MQNVISISDLSKQYKDGFTALKSVNLEIKRGEIFALLGPNGAGKTTLISIICGIVNPTSGSVMVDGFDILTQFRQTRSLIGLVPQELTTDTFETVWNTVSYSRGLFGKPKNPNYIESVLKRLTLWDKKDNRILELSGGMKRRVMIAKALSHEPKILFLDEPTAGVDVELRKNMWEQVHELRESGVTVILTTHYIDEAEEMADRVGVINNGQLLLTEEKSELMKKLGKKELSLELYEPLEAIPSSLAGYELSLANDGRVLKHTYSTTGESRDVADLFDLLKENKIRYKDLNTKQSSLEEIFVQLVAGEQE